MSTSLTVIEDRPKPARCSWSGPHGGGRSGEGGEGAQHPQGLRDRLPAVQGVVRSQGRFLFAGEP